MSIHDRFEEFQTGRVLDPSTDGEVSCPHKLYYGAKYGILGGYMMSGLGEAFTAKPSAAPEPIPVIVKV